MLNEKELLFLESQRHYFIENNRGEASYFDWLRSKGTNFECYKQYIESLDDGDRLNSKLHFLQTLIYALIVPVTSYFFYWTLIICILHHFNLKKPVMKLILTHYLVRLIGDFFDGFGNLFTRYYAYDYIDDLRINTQCVHTLSSETVHPLKWVITRHLAIIFWYIGEIFGDWYPLLRTKAVIKDNKVLLPVYFTCGLFNLSKIVLILNHLCLLPNKLYDENGVFIMEKRDNFYIYHWLYQFIIICTSILYDLSVFLVLKKNFFPINDFDFGFLKKFKTTSEFRILATAYVSIFLLPFAAIAISLKYYFLLTQRVKHAEFSFEEVRFSIINLQYHMIFVDQILLFHSSNEHSHMLSAIFNKKKKSKNSSSKQSSKSKHDNNSNHPPSSYSSNKYSIFSDSQHNSSIIYNQNNSVIESSQNESFCKHSQNDSIYKQSQNEFPYKHSQNDSILKYNQNDYDRECSQNIPNNQSNSVSLIPKLKLFGGETSTNHLIKYD